MKVEQVKEAYQRAAIDHGVTSKGLCYRNEESHHVRMAMAADYIRIVPNETVLDVGCGYGLLYKYLQVDLERDTTVEMFPNYIGVDMMPGFILKARESYPKGTFYMGDYLDNGMILPECDVTIAIGTLAWLDKDIAHKIIDKMWGQTKYLMILTLLFDNPFPEIMIRMIDKYIKLPNMADVVIHTGYTEQPEAMLVIRRKPADA